MQYLAFRLDDVEYAVDVRIVESVVMFDGATRVPSPLPYLRGVMDLRGQVIPLIDLRRKLGLSSADSDATKHSVIVFSVGQDTSDGNAPAPKLTIGAIVDEVTEVITLENGHLETASSETLALWAHYVRGVAHYESRLIVLLQAEGLFSVKELKSLRAA